LVRVRDRRAVVEPVEHAVSVLVHGGSVYPKLDAQESSRDQRHEVRSVDATGVSLGSDDEHVREPEQALVGDEDTDPVSSADDQICVLRFPAGDEVAVRIGIVVID
jgi:hypothetical protein